MNIIQATQKIKDIRENHARETCGNYFFSLTLISRPCFKFGCRELVKYGFSIDFDSSTMDVYAIEGNDFPKISNYKVNECFSFNLRPVDVLADDWEVIVEK